MAVPRLLPTSRGLDDVTSGDLVSDTFLALAFFGGFLMVLVAGAAIFENTDTGRRFADHVIRRFF